MVSDNPTRSVRHGDISEIRIFRMRYAPAERRTVEVYMVARPRPHDVMVDGNTVQSLTSSDHQKRIVLEAGKHKAKCLGAGGWRPTHQNRARLQLDNVDVQLGCTSSVFSEVTFG